ncbi:MAG TPA: ATP-binding protein [Phycisphaerae bacterium]|nr:ATP-binding protein [Phycisphaerae bacterium]
MDTQHLETLLAPYNPWWQPVVAWERSLPDYQRPVVDDVWADLRDLPQIISVTGPRRVGKSTAAKHVISRLIREQGVDPTRILYFAFDDPELFAAADLQRVIFDQLVKHFERQDSLAYFFLDEIQRLPQWELHLKKAYDLKRRIRFVVSGSASSPIFRSSQETLLGRVKDRHLLPFGFREYCQYRLRERPEFSRILEAHRVLRPALLAGDGQAAAECVNRLHESLLPFHSDVSQAVLDYCLEGGFPEVWALTDPVRKIEYLMEQQVRKVLYEDLMTLTQYRKPENVLRFFVYLLAHPGQEINTAKVSQAIGVERRVVDENLPRLELTDLLIRIQRFSHQPLRVRKGNIKCYPVDLALRNAVLKTWDMPDAAMMGLYAENLVIRELNTWPERIEVSYFREKTREVDFILTHGGDRHLPIEVKHRPQQEELASLRYFLKRFKLGLGVVVTLEQTARYDELLFLPLRYFLLAS